MQAASASSSTIAHEQPGKYAARRVRCVLEAGPGETRTPCSKRNPSRKPRRRHLERRTAIGRGPTTKAWAREAVPAGAHLAVFPCVQVAQPSSPTWTSHRQLPGCLRSPIRPERAQSSFERCASRSCFFVFACGSVGGGPGTASHPIPVSGSNRFSVLALRRSWWVGVGSGALSCESEGPRSGTWGIGLVASIGRALCQQSYPLPRTRTSARPQYLEAGGHRCCWAFSMPTHNTRAAR